jgi:hypothetical protein
MSGARFVLFGAGLTILACSGNGEPNPGAAGSAARDSVGILRPPTEIDEPDEPDAPSAVSCPGSPAPDLAVVRSCILAASCTPELLPASVSDCIAKDLLHSGAYPACISQAQSCAQIAACRGQGFYGGPCPGELTHSLCDGSRAVICEQPAFFTDCASRGASCLEYSLDAGAPAAFAGCVVAPSCSSESELFSCSGTKRVSCRNGIAFGEDCAARGLVCVDVTGGDAICAHAAASCSTPGVGQCDSAGSASYCAPDGSKLSFDCAALGFECRVAEGRTHGVECLAPGCAPEDAARCFEECDGPMAHLCLGGQRLSIDCRSYGLSDCVLETRDKDGDRARCGHD